MVEKFSLIVIGGGSAGFAAATKANDLELKTALINDGLLGGTCVNARARKHFNNFSFADFIP
jgi:mercuric reductase